VVVVQVMRTATSTYNPQNGTMSNSGTALTWTQRCEAHSASDNYGSGLVVFTAPVTTGASMTVTFTKAAGDADFERVGGHVLSFTGYDTASPVGGTLGDNAGPGDGSWSPSLSAAPALTSQVIAAIVGTCNTTLDVYQTIGTGWTSLLTRNEIQYYGYTDEVRANSTTQTILWDDVLAPSSTDTYNLSKTYGVALEIKAADALIIPAAGALGLTGYAPTVTVGVAFSGNGFVIGSDRSWVGDSYIGDIDTAAGGDPAPAAGTLSLTGYAPSVLRSNFIAAGAAALALTGYAPTVTITQVVAPAAAALSLTGAQPTVIQQAVRQPTAGTLSLAGYAPTLLRQDTIRPAAGALSLTGYAPTVTVGGPGNTTITPAAGALSLTGYQPTLLRQDSITPAAGALSLTGYQPTVTITQVVAPAAAALSLTGAQPTVIQQAVRQPTAGTLSLTGYQPTLLRQDTIRPAAGALSLTGYAPTVTVGGPGNTTITPAAGTLGLTGYAPTVAPTIWLVQSSGLKQVNASNVPFAFDMPANFTAGGTVLVGISYWSSVANDITGVDVNGVAAVKDASRVDNVNPGNLSMIELWRATNVPAGGKTVTINGTSRPGNWYISAGADEFVAFAASPVDQTATNASDGSNSTTPNATTGSTTQNDEIIATVWGEWSGLNQAPVSPPSGYLGPTWIEPSGAGQQAGGGAYKVLSSQATQNPSWTTNQSGAWGLLAVTYKLAVGGLVPAAGSLGLTGYQPGLSLTLDAPAPGFLSLTGYAPTVTVGGAGTITPAPGALSLTGYAPTLLRQDTIRPASSALSLTGYAPTVTINSPGNTTIVPAAGTLGLVGYQPTLLREDTIRPAAAALSLTGYQPTVTQKTAIEPGAGALGLTGYAPSVFLPITITPGAGSLSFTGYAPLVSDGATLPNNIERVGRVSNYQRTIIVGPRK
jgi:hypothetical protein